MKRISQLLAAVVFIMTFAGCKCEVPECVVPECPATTCSEAATPEPQASPKAEAPKPAVAAVPAGERDMEGMKEVFDFIKAQKTYYLATVENDQPRVRPFGTIEIFEGNLYIQTGRKKNVSHQIEANSRIELCTFDGERWLRLAATATADDRAEAQSHMLDAYPELKKMYAVGDGNTVVYKLTDVTATLNAFGGEPRVIRF